MSDRMAQPGPGDPSRPGGRRTRNRSSEMWSVNLGWLTKVVPFFWGLMGAGVALAYAITEIWQHLAVAGIGFLGLLISGAGWLALRRDREETAAMLMLVGAFLVAPLVSLFWAGIVPALALMAMSLAAMVVALLVFSPARWWLWALSLLIGLGIWALEPVQLPWARYDIRTAPVAAWSIQLLTIALVALVVWQLVRAYQRITEIRARLTSTLISLVLVVTLVISGTSILVGIQTARGQVYDQLETSVVLKRQAIDDWVDQLRFALDSLVVEEYEVQRAQALLLETFTLEYRLTAGHELRVRFNSVIRRTGWFTEIFLINTEGIAVLSTERALEGRSLADMRYFTEGLLDAYVAPPYYDPALGELSIVFARPLTLGAFTYGVIAARTDLSQLNAITAAGKMGETGASYVVGPGHELLTGLGESSGTTERGEPGQLAAAFESLPVTASGHPVVRSDAIETVMAGDEAMQRGSYVNHLNVPVLGVAMGLPELSSALVAEFSQTEMLRGARTASLVNAAVALVAMLSAAAVAIVFARGISEPISALATTATRIAGGELSLEAQIERDDEVGLLALAFNAMTTQLRDLIGGLEARVAERTRGLQAVTEVSRATTSVLDPDELLPQVVEMVRQRFNLYYAGLFLLDEAQGYAVLRAGTGDAGAAMLAQGWRLPLDGNSMIGQCVTSEKAIIKQQAGDSVVRFDNPFLPETQSELALPLRYGTRMIGAMTIQSDRASAFDETGIAVLQNLADQVAVAVQNAALFAETQTELKRARRLQQRYQRQAWTSYLQVHTTTGYEQQGKDVLPLGETLLPEVRKALASGGSLVEKGQLRVPIRQAGKVVGILGLERDASWTAAEAALVEGLAEQLGVAAENQRLLEESQRREAAERLMRQVTSRMRQSLEQEAVLQVAAEEIRLAFGCDRVVVRALVEGQPGAGFLSDKRGIKAASDLWDPEMAKACETGEIVISGNGTLAVPVQSASGDAIAVVSVQLLSDQAGWVSERVALMAQLSMQLSQALERARLYQEMQRRADEFSQLYEAGIDLITILDAETLLERAAEWTRRVLGAERAVVYLRDPQSGQKLQGQSASEPRYRLEAGWDAPSVRDLIERIMQTQHTLLIADCRETDMPGAAALVRAGLLSQMATPLKVGVEVLGVLAVNNASARMHGEQEKTLLTFLAAQVSSALQNSLQFEKTERALAVVGRQAQYQTAISQAVALLNEQGTSITGKVLGLLGSAAGVACVGYYEPLSSDAALMGDVLSGDDPVEVVWQLAESRSEDNVSRQSALTYAGPRRIAVNQMEDWAGALSETGFAVGRSEDLRREESTVALAESGSGFMLGLAVPGPAPLPGLIAFFCEEETLWDEQEIVALQTAAAALSNVLARERLFEQVQQTLSETEALYRGAAALSEASSYQAILEVLLEYTVLGDGAGTATLQLFDKIGNDSQLPDYAEVVAARWADLALGGPEGLDHLRRRFELRRFPAALRLMQDGAPMFVEDLNQAARTNDGRLDRRARALFGRVQGAHSLILVPLIVGGHRIGLLHADYADQRTFSDTERRRLVSLAQQASIAALNIRQLQATQARAQREQLIRQITGRIQEAGDVEGVLQTAVQELGRAFGTQRNRILFRSSAAVGEGQAEE